MNIILSAVGRWWRFVFFSVWLWVLLGLLRGGRYTMFLRPEFGWVLGLGAVSLLGLLAASMERPVRLGLAQALRIVILLVPLAYLANARGTELNSYVLKKRIGGAPTLAAQAQPLSSSPLPPSPRKPATIEHGSSANAVPVRDQDAHTVSAPREIGRRPPPEAKVVTILDLYQEPRFYEGKRVKLTGMVVRDEEMCGIFGQKARVVFRFVINCCAADATPAAMIWDGDTPLTLTEDAWVSVEGTFSLREQGGRQIPVLGQATMASTTAPEQPYLY